MTTSAPFLLGVDGGGTSTTAWLANAEGVVLASGQSGPSNIKAIGGVAARWALEQSITMAFAALGLAPHPVQSACLGLAGFDRVADRALLELWNKESNWAHQLVFANDGELVIAAGTPEGWGLGIIAGTGSIAVGRTPDGRLARAGGWGPLLGDEGSGYAVALQALRLVARRFDGRDPRPQSSDALTTRICHSLGISSPSELVATIYAPGIDRARLAALAADVVAAANDDPEIEQLILEPAGHELAIAVATVARHLGWTTGPIPLALAGGFILAAKPVSASLLSHLATLGYQVEPREVPDPVRGAVLLAGRALG